MKPGRDEYYWEGTIEDGTGRVKKYRSEIGKWYELINFNPVYQAYQLEERLPNGNIIKYGYENFYKNIKGPRYKDLVTYYLLTKIEAFSFSGTPLGRIDLTYCDRKGLYQRMRYIDHIDIKGSDGRNAIYTHEIREIQERNVRREEDQIIDAVLKRVDSPGKPPQTYRYRWDDDSVEAYFKTPFLNDVSNCSTHFETTYNIRTEKVVAQRAPVGPNGEMHPIARYEYHGDHTIVYDGENRKTIFRFNKEKRITAVEKYEGDRLSCVQKSKWDPESGNLVKTLIEDGKGEILQIAEFEYDTRQNAIIERTGDANGSDMVFRS
ncbi:MAG: hypothetical protein JJU12_05750 [Chlamydiales bacterium]|nr:hypothetical protein [Chlamydiales bacterium]